VTIKRIYGIKLKLNPYELENKDYFHKKRTSLVVAKFTEKLLKKYKYTCPHCKGAIPYGEKMELHHIIPQKEGGLTTLKNMMPLHRICHQQITHASQEGT
jgi:RNA-directed DNA polymerase